jgi:succinoglycan biosynthesis transport protein ExoP
MNDHIPGNNGASSNGGNRDSFVTYDAARGDNYPRAAQSARGALPQGPGTTVQPAYQGDTIDLGSVFSTIWRRRRLMLKTGAIVFVVGILLMLRQKSVYQSTCSILVTAPSDNSPAVSSSLRDLLNSSQPRSVGTQLAIMRSYPVQRAAVKRLSAAEQEKASRFYTLDVHPQRDSDAIDIVAESYDPHVAAKLANSLSSEYMWQYQQQNRAQVQAGTREVAQQLAAAKRRLNEASNNLKLYKLSHGTIDLSEESKARLASIHQIEANLRDLRTDRAAKVAHVAVLSRQISSMPSVQVWPDRIVRRPEVEALRGQLNQLEIQRIATLRRYRPNSPEVQTLETQSADIRQRLKDAVQTEVSSWTRSINPVRQGLERDIASTQAGIWSIDAQVRALQQSAKQERAQEALLPEKEFRMNQLTTEQAVLQQTYQVLNEKYQSLLVSEGAKLSTARLLAPAEPSANPVRPRRALSLLMTLMMSLAIAIVAAIIADRLDDRIRTAAAAEEAAQLPVLTQIPLVEGEGVASLVGKTESSSPLLESFRVLRTQLTLTSGAAPSRGGVPALPAKSVKSVLITSSREGEGKSFCALNLAVATAIAGKSVVLIDCDLRRPTLHTMLGLSGEDGLTDVIMKKVRLADAVQQTEIPGMSFLPAGSWMADSTELLDSEAARNCLRSAIASADLAILSCPPIPYFADTQIIATLADAALLVVASDEAERNDVARARELLDQTGIQTLGIVLNKVTSPDPNQAAYLYNSSSYQTTPV